MVIHARTAFESALHFNTALHRIEMLDYPERLAGLSNDLDSRAEECILKPRGTNESLAQAAQTKGAFFASMSHELRAPLTNILNLTAVLQEQVLGPLNEEQRNLLSTVEESGHHLLNLVNDILDASKMEAGQLKLNLDPCPVDMVCQSSLHLINGLAERRRQKVQYAISPQNLIIHADALRLKQILVNLLSNAVKFTPEGGALGLEVTGDTQAGVIHFSVWYTGTGIPSESFPQLFQPFSQINPRQGPAIPGTGLGLAIIQQLADLHGGSVSLESIRGKGSRFTVHIPFDLSSQASLIRDEISRMENSLPISSEGQSRLDSKKEPCVLLVDDNPLNLDYYARYLRQFHYLVCMGSNGLEALELAHDHHPDLILMDVQMPGMDGITAIQRLRADPDQRLARTPIIALTALAMPGDRERCLEAGSDDYQCKPIPCHKLLHLTKMHLGEASHILKRPDVERHDVRLKERRLGTSCVP